VGVTFAEPAIGALQAVGTDVDCSQSPYLWLLLNGWSFQLVLAVGAGVGVAAVIGVLRFLEGWSLKPIIYILLAITLSLTGVVQVFTHETHGVIALAWDCGAVTTGPVTVPTVIALGLGVCAASPSNSGDNPLAAFGLVTMASLLPITSVLSLAIYLHSIKSPESIVDMCKDMALAAAEGGEQALLGASGSWDGGLADGVGGNATMSMAWEIPAWVEATPAAEIISGTRALGPLVLFMCLTLKVGLCDLLPRVRIVAQGKLREGGGKVVAATPGAGCATTSPLSASAQTVGAAPF